jgi:hypothetical protein
MPINPALLLSQGAPGVPLPAPGPGGLSPASSPMSAGSPLPSPGPMAGGPAPMPPGAGLSAMNSAALLAMQGQVPEPPPNWTVDTQADGTLLLTDLKPDGTKIIRKIISPPKSPTAKGK